MDLLQKANMTIVSIASTASFQSLPRHITAGMCLLQKALCMRASFELLLIECEEL